MSKIEDLIGSTIFDLTHLEINTIIKDEMSASKAPASPRLLLHRLASIYDQKLVSMGEPYLQYLGQAEEKSEHLFRGDRVKEGSGYDSFHELSDRASNAAKMIKDNKANIPFAEDRMDADMMMLKRIETISNDVRRILKMKGVDPYKDGDTYNFDDPETINKFRFLPLKEAETYELNLDLRQLLVIKKANDVGTERVVLQTIIGMDGDVTTRVSKAFAEQPISFISGMHHEAIGISVDFWKTLIQIVVQLGERILGMATNK
jgi:hypothetical protein